MSKTQLTYEQRDAFQQIVRDEIQDSREREQILAKMEQGFGPAIRALVETAVREAYNAGYDDGREIERM